MSEPKTEVTRDGESIEVTLLPRHGKTVDGWPEAREDLGLNPHGHPQEGIEIVEEQEHFHDEDDEYPYGYGPVVLRFDGEDSLEAAKSHLYDQATERFEWGDRDGAGKIQDFASALPTSFDVAEASA